MMQANEDNESIGLNISQRQKDQAHLFTQYNEAMRLLKSKRLDQGQKMLEEILVSEAIDEAQLRKLKRSVILSMGNVLLIRQQNEMALSYFNEALQLQERIVREEQESQSFDPNTTISQQYMLLMKMYELSQGLGYKRESVYFLKKALVVCPSLWRERIIGLLQREYRRQGMKEELYEIGRLKLNDMMLRRVISEQQKRIWLRCRYESNKNNHISEQSKMDIQGDERQLLNVGDKNKLRGVRISVPYGESSSSYSQFEYILTVCYVLLKCQSKRNFNRKRYLHKKYDSNNAVWTTFLNSYDLARTKLQLACCQDQSTMLNNINEESLSLMNQQSASKQLMKQEKQSSHQELIQQLTTELLRIKYTKKKKNSNKHNLQGDKQQQKQHIVSPQQKDNQTAKLSKLPQDQPIIKFTNKKQLYQQPSKQIYQSMASYCKQVSDKNGMDREQLRWLSQLDQQMYLNLWSAIVDKDDDEAQQRQQDDVTNVKSKSRHNKQFQSTKKHNQYHIQSNTLEQQKKLNHKDKKQLQLKKISYHNSLFTQFLSLTIKSKTNDQSQQDSARFINCYDLLDNLIFFILKKEKQRLIWKRQGQVSMGRGSVQIQSKQLQEQMQYINANSWKDFSLYNSPPIRRLLAKCILKIISLDSNWLSSTITNNAKNNSSKSKRCKEQNEREIRLLAQYDQYLISSILIQHYEYMSMKPQKTTQFTPHQINKIAKLKNYIQQHYQLSNHLVKNQNLNISIQKIYVMALRTEKLVYFYTCMGNINQELLDFYKQLWSSQYKDLKEMVNQQSAGEKIELNSLKKNIVEYIDSMSQSKINTLIGERQQKAITIMTNNSPSNATNATTQCKNLSLNILHNSNTTPQPNNNTTAQPLQIESLLLALQYSSITTNQQQPYLLPRIINHLSAYFNKLQQQSELKQEFSIKSMDLLTRQMKVQQLILKLYTRLRSGHGSGIVKEFDMINGNQREMLIGLMIKLCVMGSLTNNDDCLRILFYLTNSYLKQSKNLLSMNNHIKSNNHQQNQKSLFTHTETPFNQPQTTLTYKLIILYKSLIDYSEKRQKLESYSLVLRKLYDNIIGKNLHTIYEGSRQQWGKLLTKWKQRQEENKSNLKQIEQEIDNGVEGQYKKELQLREQGQMIIEQYHQPILDLQNNINPQHKNTFTSTQQLKTQESPVSQYFLMHSRLNPVLHQIYHSPQSEFQPKRIQDAVGYFIYLSRYFYQEFLAEQEVELSSHVMKMFRKCYSVYNEKKSETIKLCDSFKQALIRVERYFDGLDKQNQKLMSILKGEIEICECCRSLNIMADFDYSQIIYILARVFQSNPIGEQSSQGTHNKAETSQLDEQYYKQYLMLNLRRPQSWMNYIRIQCKKAFLYFDSLVGVDPLEKYKNKFLFTKKIINFVKLYLKHTHSYSTNQQKNTIIPQLFNTVNQQQQHELKGDKIVGGNQQQEFNSFKKLLKYSTLTLNTLNVLKLKQREFLMTLKSQQTISTQQSFINKKEIKQYKELSKKYLQGLKTIRQKYDWQQNSIASMYLGLVEVEMTEITHLLQRGVNTELLKRVDSIEEEVRKLIGRLGLYESKENYALHLEEDLVVDYYILLGRVLESILSITVKSNTNPNNTSNQMSKHQKNTELLQLEKYLTYCLSRANRLTLNSKYQLTLLRKENQNKSQNSIDQNNKDILHQRIPSQLQTIREAIEEEDMIKESNNEIIEEEAQGQVFNKEIIEYEGNQQNENKVQEEQEYQYQKPEEEQAQISEKNQYENHDRSIIRNSKQFTFMPLQTPASTNPSQQLNQSTALNTSTNVNANKKTTKKLPQPTLSLIQFYRIQLNYPIISTQTSSNAAQTSLSTTQTSSSTTQISFLQTSIINKINTFLNAICILFKSLSKYQLKRYKYRRSVTQSLLYTSKLFLKYSIYKQHALEIIKDYYNIRSDDIVFLFTHSDRNKPTQKNLQLAEFYNRALVHNLQRFWFIKHLIDSFGELKNIENLIVLLRKLNKLMVVDEGKQVQYLVTLYCYGVDKYLDLVQQIADKSQLQERYEKILIEFRNKIKRSIQIRVQIKKIQPKLNQPSTSPNQQQSNLLKEAREKAVKQNYYHQRLDKFIKQYQVKYDRKVKLKKSKKDRQLQKQLKQKQLSKLSLSKQLGIQKEKEVQIVNQRLEQQQIQKEIQLQNELMKLDKVQIDVDKGQLKLDREEMEIQKKQPEIRELIQTPLQIERVRENKQINQSNRIERKIELSNGEQILQNEVLPKNPQISQSNRNTLKKDQIKEKKERKQRQTKKKKEIINLLQSSQEHQLSQQEQPHEQHSSLSPKRKQSEFMKKVKEQMKQQIKEQTKEQMKEQRQQLTPKKKIQISKDQKPVKYIVIDVDENQNNQAIDTDQPRKFHKTQ